MARGDTASDPIVFADSDDEGVAAACAHPRAPRACASSPADVAQPAAPQDPSSSLDELRTDEEGTGSEDGVGVGATWGLSVPIRAADNTIEGPASFRGAPDAAPAAESADQAPGVADETSDRDSDDGGSSDERAAAREQRTDLSLPTSPSDAAVRLLWTALNKKDVGDDEDEALDQAVVLTTATAVSEALKSRHASAPGWDAANV